MTNSDDKQFRLCPTCGEDYPIPEILLCPNCFKKQCRECDFIWIAQAGIYACPSCGCKEIDVINTKKYIIDIIERLRLEYENEHQNNEKGHSPNHNVGSAGNNNRI